MEVYAVSKKLHRKLSSHTALARAYGDRAGVIERRISEMTAATDLEMLFTLPGARCHELSGKEAGRFAVDLKHPYRLVFRPCGDYIPRKPDGGIDLKAVKSVEILEVMDYHD